MQRRTKRQQDIETLLTAFEQFFPGVEPPAIKYVCAWLYRLSVESILSVFERVAAIDAERPFDNPIGVIWNFIKNECVATGVTLRFDIEGQRQ